jgi:DNA-binding transcriptional MerR regulator
MQREFTSKEVVALTGITARQLQWWDERGIVVPARKRHRRVYSLEHLTEIAIIRDLKDRNFPLQRVRNVIAFLHREFGEALAETVSRSSQYHLLTDGESIYVETSARDIVDILKNARHPMLDICLSDKVREVKAVIRGADHLCSKRSQAVQSVRRARAA